jgi:hypothetical protein
MTRRRKLLVAGAAALVTVAAWWGFRSPPYITLEQFGRIEVGMTLDEVAATLGGPPRLHVDSDGCYLLDRTRESFDRMRADDGLLPAAITCEWYADSQPPRNTPDGQVIHEGWFILVGMNDQGLVCDKKCAQMSFVGQSILGKARRWCGKVAARLGF